jgi:cation transport regulator ChaC
VTGFVAYGSLMHPDELAAQCHGTRQVRVRVRGFRRNFSQEPSWRTGTGVERGVLTVQPSPGDWFNGILVSDADAEVLRSLDHRERGYSREAVPATRIEAYDPADSAQITAAVVVHAGLPDKYNSELLPNSSYLELCTDAAARWGSDFARDFRLTTFVRGATLDEFMRR